MTEAVAQAVAALRAAGSPTHRDGNQRFGIVTSTAFGVPMKDIQALGKQLGTRHELADPLWDTGYYEARLLVAYIADPARVTLAQMDRWCAAFDNWAVCDTLCFALFDRTPHAFDRIAAWQAREEEFVKRAAFALLAGVALHRKARAIDGALATCLPYCEAAATDARNFVKKGTSWALRAIGARDAELHATVIALATRLAARPEPAARWLGKDVLRDLQRPLITRRFAAARRTP